MSFQQTQLTKSVNQAQDIFDEYIYRPTNGDTLDDIISDGYFAQSRYVGSGTWVGSLLTFYTEGSLYNAKITSDNVVLLSGSGDSFAIGPTPNEFRSATLTGAIVLLEAQTLAFPDWLAVYDAAPLSALDNASLNVRIFYTIETVNYMDLMARDNSSWVINQSFSGIQGEPGTDGINGSGATSAFPNITAMDAYFLDEDRFKSLKTDDNSSVTIDGVVFQFIWRGIDGPQTYDSANWERAEIGTTAGSLIMGPASIESAAQVLMYKDATGGSNYVIQSFFDTTGSKVPIYYELSAESVFDLALIDTDVLIAPMKAETVMAFQSMSDAFICKPASAGTLVYKTWIGTESSHDDQPILNERVDITPAMVGVETKIPIKNPVIINQDESLYSEITGVDLYGGLQDAGPMIGQTVPFNKLHLQTVTQRFIALADEVESNLSGTTDAAKFTIDNDNGTGVVIPKVTSSIAGLMIPSDSDKLDGIQAGAQVNSGTVKVKDAGAYGFLEAKLKAGDNVTLEVTDDDITISSTGGGEVDIGGIKVGDIYKQGLRFTTPSDEDFVIPQVKYEEGSNIMGAPFFFNKGTGVVDVYPSVNRVDTNAIQVKSAGYQQELTGYNGQPINKMKIKVGGNHEGVKFSLALSYANEFGVPKKVNTEQITCTNAVQTLDVDILTSIVMKSTGSIYIKVGANYSSTDTVELMGETGAFAENLWIDWSAENIGGTTNLAIDDEIFFDKKSPTSYISLVDAAVVYTVPLTAGVYDVSTSCGFKCDTGNSARWCQIEAKLDSTIVFVASDGIANNGTGANYCTPSQTDRLTVVGNQTLTIALGSSNPTVINYQGLGLLVTKVR